MPQTVDENSLASWIDSQPTFRGAGWFGQLEDRKKEEAEFHDEDRADHRDESQDSTPNRRFYRAATVIDRYLDQWIERLAGGAVFLDYACGNGTKTIRAAQSDVRLAVGIDISAVSVRNAQESAQRVGVGEKTRFLQRDCENTQLPSASYDAILCSGMLHHLDLNRAYPELQRLLKPHGRVLCIEALAHNPVIQLYRHLTPELRTRWESQHIVGMREINLAERWFRVENVKFFLMVAPLATMLPGEALRRAGLAVGHAVDSVLTRIPLLQLWSWQVSFELVRDG